VSHLKLLVDFPLEFMMNLHILNSSSFVVDFVMISVYSFVSCQVTVCKYHIWIILLWV
jgi:hypothetical protein